MTTDRPALLPRVAPGDIRRAVRPPVAHETLATAGAIVERVRLEGATAVRAIAEQFGERTSGDPLVLGVDEMRSALDALPRDQRGVLERTAGRIRAFAAAQRAAILPVEVPVEGGRAGHTIVPVESAGCYAPAGRYPLPSSVLMTAVTARVAGCTRVVVASPGARPEMLAAAAIAGADEFLAVGGAHAIAAMAFGCEGLSPCDVIVGPGNKWVTAAKHIVAGVAGIDMLAGPSELLVIADESADAGVVAADLLAQAEHDTDAVPMLITTSPSLADRVDVEMMRQIAVLPTRDAAAAALRNGFVCVVSSLGEACRVADQIAAEHVELMTADPRSLADSLKNAGAIFIGSASAEVLGDYGAGPNHTLPTGGTARFKAGLSVDHFLRRRTWLRIDHPPDASQLIADACALASMEGLAGHRASAELRRPVNTASKWKGASFP